MDEQKKLLIVEDEQALLFTLTKAFEKEGYQIFTATNGQEGLDQAIKERPDMILLDILLPIMDGVTMLKKLRDTKEGKGIPVIILTNLNYVKDLEPYVHFPSHLPTQSGNISEFLVKTDWKLEEVIQKVKDNLK